MGGDATPRCIGSTPEELRQPEWKSREKDHFSICQIQSCLHLSTESKSMSRDERRPHAVLTLTIAKKRAHMTSLAELGTGKRNGGKYPIRGSFSMRGSPRAPGESRMSHFDFYVYTLVSVDTFVQ